MLNNLLVASHLSNGDNDTDYFTGLDADQRRENVQSAQTMPDTQALSKGQPWYTSSPCNLISFVMMGELLSASVCQFSTCKWE